MRFKIKHTIFICLIFGLISCVSEEQLPSGILSEDQMVQVITELELTQGLIKLKLSIPDTSAGDTVILNKQELFNEVYAQFNISEEQFNNSLSYYCIRPSILENIYTQVINNLSAKQADYQ